MTMLYNRTIIVVALLTWLAGIGLMINKYLVGWKLPFGDGLGLTVMGITFVLILMLSQKKRPKLIDQRVLDD